MVKTEGYKSTDEKEIIAGIVFAELTMYIEETLQYSNLLILRSYICVE